MEGNVLQAERRSTFLKTSSLVTKATDWWPDDWGSGVGGGRDLALGQHGLTDSATRNFSYAANTG